LFRRWFGRGTKLEPLVRVLLRTTLRPARRWRCAVCAGGRGFSFKARRNEADERPPHGGDEERAGGAAVGIFDKLAGGAKAPDESARRARLAELTATAKRGLAAFAETGAALAAIQAEELWRLSAPTWDSWCSSELGLTERRVGQLIEAARTCSTLKETGVLPRSERVARELAGLPPEQKVDAWKEAVAAAGGEQPTAEQVSKAARKRKPKKARKPPVAKATNYRVPGAAVRIVPRKSGFTSYVAALEHALELARKAEQEAAKGNLRVA
jgi:hypothetical protein